MKYFYSFIVLSVLRYLYLLLHLPPPSSSIQACYCEHGETANMDVNNIVNGFRRARRSAVVDLQFIDVMLIKTFLCFTLSTSTSPSSYGI